MKVLFIGCVNFSYSALQKLIDMKVDVTGLVTTANKTLNSDHADLSGLAEENEIPTLSTDNINSPETVTWIKRINPDVIFCFGWSRLIGREILSLPPLGVIGFHPAALPKNRGRHPIIWALSLGLKETASSFFIMEEGPDSGPIISQMKIKIEADDRAHNLYRKITDAAISQLEEFVPALAQSKSTPIAQDHLASNIWRKRTKRDGFIDWRMDAESIRRLVYALSAPYPGAHFVYQDTEYVCWDVETIDHDSTNIEPGKVLAVSSEGWPVIKCGLNAIRILHAEPELNLKEGEYL